MQSQLCRFATRMRSMTRWAEAPARQVGVADEAGPGGRKKWVRRITTYTMRMSAQLGT